MLPSVDPTTHLLPATVDNTPYPATLQEVRETFVERAPNPDRRRLIFRAFEVYSEVVWEHLPDARLWLDGGFVTHKDAPPHDLDVVIVTTEAALRKATEAGFDIHANITLEEVSARFPPVTDIPKLQTYGGLVDSFLAFEEVSESLEYWRDQWSRSPASAGGYSGDIRKGYLEVTVS